MATFPALNPNTRTYTPGAAPNTPIAVMTGDETGVRHTNGATGHVLRLSFNGLTPAQHFEITSHYSLHARFQSFDIPAATLQGSDLTFPSGYEWIYAASPQTEYLPGVVTVSVELQLVPPYLT
jgi:hypothetical protein